MKKDQHKEMETLMSGIANRFRSYGGVVFGVDEQMQSMFESLIRRTQENNPTLFTGWKQGAPLPRAAKTGIQKLFETDEKISASDFEKLFELCQPKPLIQR